MLIDRDVELLFGERGIGGDVVGEFNDLNVETVLFGDFSGLRHNVRVGAGRHGDLHLRRTRGLGRGRGSSGGGRLFIGLAAGGEEGSRGKGGGESNGALEEYTFLHD